MTNSLSIITVNYNNADGLSKTIKSILNQSFKGFEYIIIDGGSTDNSLEIIKTHKEHITHWVSEPDKGVYNAMNKGLRVATGEYVLFMNSGDYLYSSKVLEQALKNISTNDDLIYGDVVLINNELNTERVQVHPKTPSFSYFYKQTICQQACFIKRDLFDRIFYFNEDYKISADWEFLIYAIYIEKVNFKKIDVIISVYDMGGISSTSKYRPIASKEREKTMDKYFPLFKEDYKIFTSYSSQRFSQLKRIESSVFLRKVVSVLFKLMLFLVPNKRN
jgi:glycosyltransferase involved in cell wall biosynthesis